MSKHSHDEEHEYEDDAEYDEYEEEECEDEEEIDEYYASPCCGATPEFSHFVWDIYECDTCGRMYCHECSSASTGDATCPDYTEEDPHTGRTVVGRVDAADTA